jgi:flagellar motor protein MotB
MAEKKNVTIVIKKIQPHAHAPHGGAWKVAYADFVTAMMAFFLVMWLLGSDEEIRAAVAQYFNNPSSIWQPDLASKEMIPLGDKTGAGESVMKGADGATPEDMVERPARPFQLHTQEGEDDGDVIQPLVAGRDIMDIEVLRFTIPLRTLFKRGSHEPSPEAMRAIQKIGKLTQGYKGVLTISTDRVDVKLSDGKAIDPYEFALTRSVKLGNLLLKNHHIDEQRLVTAVRDPETAGEAADPKKAARKATVVEFTLTPKKK